MAKGLSVLDVVRGISQAVSNSHDGALDENGEPVKIGLRREEEVSIYDKRVMDGFSIRLFGEKNGVLEWFLMENTIFLG